MQKKFALIGKTLKHSYSPKIHALLGDYSYDLVEVSEDALKDFVLNSNYNGYNVTIPYKKAIMPYLDYVDQRAKDIGAVNTVVVKDGKRYGYNTDFDGMAYMIKRAGIVVEGKTAVILGSGGTSNTAKAVLKFLGAKEIFIVSRSGEINYQNCYDIPAQIIVNTTPVGMYPDNYSCPVDLQKFNLLEGVVDVVYNPSKTALTFNAEKLGVLNTNGLSMLVAQAKYASEKFLSNEINDNVIEKVVKKLSKDTLNIVLVGMPSCGKSTVGGLLAKALNKEFIDTDAVIESRYGSIPTIFAEHGEKYFRQLESAVIKEVGALSGKIIATGGGAVKDKENYFPLKQNAKIFYIERAVDKLVCDGRPLSKDMDTVKKLYEERKDLYEFFADVKVDNNSDAEKAVEGVINSL